MASAPEPVGDDRAPTATSGGTVSARSAGEVLASDRSDASGLRRQDDPGAEDRRPGARSRGSRSRGSKRPGSRRPGSRRRRERRVMLLVFLGPALLMLLVLVCYPIVYTIWLSLHSRDGGSFIGIDNYITMFTASETRKAITNNVIWVVVAPSVVTTLGLIFAVLTERVRRSAALKAILFMPMAISFLAAGITFRLVYDESPDRGALNAALVAVHDTFAPPSRYFGADPRGDGPLTAVDGAFQTSTPVSPGTVAALPLVGLPQDRIPADATIAEQPPTDSALSGVVWLDFTRGGGGTAGTIDPTERGLPGMTVEALRDGEVVASTTTDDAGQFRFAELTEGSYTLRLAAENFAEPYRGLTWLGPNLITPAVIGAYIWTWAGFAMVLISAGLAALPREALEAARVDGATEWQVFHRVTIPLVRPVLIVVLVTLTINVLKIFDLVYVLAPESMQDEANVVALEMYRVSFGGGLDYGLGSALAVLLFILVLPAMLFNIRRLRRDQG